MQFFLKNIDGPTTVLEASPTDTVASLQTQIFVRSGIHPHHQLVVFGGKSLQESRTLQDYGIESGSTLHLTLRLRGGSMLDFSAGFSSPSCRGNLSSCGSQFLNCVDDNSAQPCTGSPNSVATDIFDDASTIADANKESSLPQKRKVSFHPTAKAYDGLRSETYLFHEYMTDAFRLIRRPQRETIVAVLAHQRNVEGLASIRKNLVALLVRCQQSSTGRAIILNRGGGRCGNVTRQHIPYLKQHVHFLDNVIQKVRREVAELQQQQQL